MNDIVVNATKYEIVLPVTLSDKVRRELFIATGAEPDRWQVVRVEDLAELPRPLRERIVDLIDQVRVSTAEDWPPGEPLTEGPAAKAYGTLIRGVDDWAIWDSPDRSTELRKIFRAGPGRTLTLSEVAAQECGEAVVDALLAGRPLVDGLSEGSTVTVEDVVAAYEGALALAGTITTLMDGCHVGKPGFLESVQLEDDFIFIEPLSRSSDDRLDPIGLVEQSDPAAFAKAQELCTRVVELSTVAQEEFATDAGASVGRLRAHGYERDRLTDADIVSLVLPQAAQRAHDQEQRREATKRAREQYERERAAWTADRGSKRLRLAAERGYKHDGLYRDERLANELPRFIAALPRRSEIKEIINPSEFALDLESQAIRRLEGLGATDTTVKLVFAIIDSRDESELDDGEYVQVTGYLGQHTVWQSVAQAADEIPF